MIKRKLSLRSRIFFFMIMLVVVASILIAVVTIIQYKDQSQDYHRQRLERKEALVVLGVFMGFFADSINSLTLWITSEVILKPSC